MRIQIDGQNIPVRDDLADLTLDELKAEKKRLGPLYARRSEFRDDDQYLAIMVYVAISIMIENIESGYDRWHKISKRRNEVEKGKVTPLMKVVNQDVLVERHRQNEKHGIQRHDNGTWLAILGEEFGEVCQALQYNMGWAKPTDKGNLYEELMHVAAVASAWAEQVKEGQGAVYDHS